MVTNKYSDVEKYNNLFPTFFRRRFLKIIIVLLKAESFK